VKRWEQLGTLVDSHQWGLRSSKKEERERQTRNSRAYGLFFERVCPGGRWSGRKERKQSGWKSRQGWRETQWWASKAIVTQTLGKDGVAMLEDYRRWLDYWRSNDGMYPENRHGGDHEVTRSGEYIASETHYIRAIRTVEFYRYV
jgi:hypothetical protein